MLTIASTGPDNPNQAILPFVALKGSIGGAQSGLYPEEEPEMFLMQEAIYLGTKQTDLTEIKAVGLPPIAEVLEFLRDHNFRMVVCEPCAVGRGITETSHLINVAEMGEASDLAHMTQRHDAVLTF